MPGRLQPLTPSIDQTLAMANHSNGTARDEPRSAKAAEEAAAKQPSEARQPLASHKPVTSRPGVTFAAQDSLPKLPIPDLDATCKRYLESLEPLQGLREHEETKGAVDEFLRHEGPDLQERLKKYASGKSSYIEQFWYDSYLNFDNPVVLNLNPFFLLEDDPTPARNNQVTRAASLVVSSLCFVRAIRKQELPPDMLRKTPLCMYQYSRMFGTARVPTEHGCHIAQDPTSRHIVVLARGQFYWFDVLDDNNDLIMNENDIAQNLDVIRDDAEQTPVFEAAKGAVGVLSTENRKVWFGLREVMSREEGSNNAECLEIIDSALFIVCLDDTEPKSTSELCTNMLCGTSEVSRGIQIGTCTNRWYDKLQIIVCKNGSAGVNFEHTGVDGHTVLRFASDVYTDTILRFAKSINGLAPSLWASNSPDPSKRDPASFGHVSTTPHKLEWDMVPELSTALRFAETRLADLIQQNEFQTLDFSAYGKNFITSMGFSPDAFVQMAFQAAYYGMYGRVECAYEPAMTKVYFHGRTEAIRPVTNEVVNFVHTFWGDNPAGQKVEALRAAASKHTHITKQCAQAQGQDRHLYALFCVWQRTLDAALHGPDSGSMSPTSATDSDDAFSDSSVLDRQRILNGGIEHRLPSIFADAGWDKLNNTILSTSNCGNPSLRHFGFGPTSGDGFGIGYVIKDHSIAICASSKHRQTRRFVEAIELYFLEIRKLLRATHRRPTTSSTRAREIEEASAKNGRTKSRGRSILGDKEDVAKTREAPIEEEEEEDDGLGGYGFFDAGMLKQALMASEKKTEENNPSAGVARRSVGRKLPVTEY